MDLASTEVHVGTDFSRQGTQLLGKETRSTTCHIEFQPLNVDRDIPRSKSVIVRSIVARECCTLSLWILIRICAWLPAIGCPVSEQSRDTTVSHLPKLKFFTAAGLTLKTFLMRLKVA